MVDPTRKRRKTVLPPILTVVQASEAADPLRFATLHPKRPAFMDLHEFADGTLNRVVPYPQWGGAFRGRPALITELAPHIRALYRKAPEATVDGVVTFLRAWWRLFDETEELAKVDVLEDISDLHGALQLRADFNTSYRSQFLRLVNLARKAKALPPLDFPAADTDPKLADSPKRKAVAAVYYDLKCRVRGVVARFEAADAAAAAGRVWQSEEPRNALEAPLQEEDVHATYRAAILAKKHPCPASGVGLFLSREADVEPLERMSLPVFGLYPSKADTQAFFLLFLLRTGWNAQTAIDLDVEGNWRAPHPTSPEHHLVRSTKTRGNTEQVAVGLEKSQTSPGRLLDVLIERTAPLRALVKEKLSSLEAQYRISPSEELRLEITEVRARSKSPWLFVDVTRQNTVLSLTVGTYGYLQRQSVLRLWIRDLNAKTRATSKADKPYLVPETFTISDFRDAYVGFAYEASGFNWLVAKLAAGHTSINSLKAYLRKRRWKAEGEKKVSAVQEALWKEITERRIVDPVFLRALVDRGAISEEQRQRWLDHKDRTRVGTGCRDFKNPPKSVAPEHVPGTGCRVQRCTLCSHGIVFQDSVSHLARRLAELETLRESLPLATWIQSSFPEELEATEATLTLFDPETVRQLTKHWHAEIQAGRHTVLQFEGAYA